MADPRAALSLPWWAFVFLSVVSLMAALFPAAQAKAAEMSVKRGVRRSSRTSGNGDYHFNRMERCFMRKINRVRAHSGLQRLSWDKQIGYVARLHARRMARSSYVAHDPRLAREITHWRALGQNSGGGGRCAKLFRSFWASPGHRRNILGRWRFVGVGARWHRGWLYVQQVFEYRSNPGNVYGYP
jgi:uncharacterized protein YkwD